MTKEQKNKHAQALGKLGAKARWDGTTLAQRQEHGRHMKAGRKDAQGKKMRKSLKEQAKNPVDNH